VLGLTTEPTVSTSVPAANGGGDSDASRVAADAVPAVANEPGA
jgi:hypothetical protein